MTPRPIVSIIMAKYNGRRFLRPALRSVLRQTLPERELLFVDDASTESSVACAKSIAGSDRRIKVLERRQNGGAGAARNTGLAEARGDWIAIVDSDDLILPYRLERMLERAKIDNASI